MRGTPAPCSDLIAAEREAHDMHTVMDGQNRAILDMMQEADERRPACSAATAVHAIPAARLQCSASDTLRHHELLQAGELPYKHFTGRTRSLFWERPAPKHILGTPPPSTQHNSLDSTPAHGTTFSCLLSETPASARKESALPPFPAMPRVTISIAAPGTPSDSDLLTLELPPGSTIKDLKGFIEAETNLPSASQSIYLNGQPVVHETQTLEDAGISDGEMLAVLVRQNQPPPQARAPPGSRLREPDPEGVRQQLLTNPTAQAELRQRDPELAAAADDANRWRETFTMRQQQVQNAERERQNQIALLNEDPFNVEAQRKIEELIRQDRVVENLEKAYNENPEGMPSSLN
ncbi:hypothetical protein EK21DRAFT_89524 [Setomelanomma holmii]|uniref:Ubiquitin-like domain-containing protein n=1 Tax=Setomelanomma holmii TaxID=210430 RepID=A0A9P4H909_9PLEO|nr:hypothetical protein EK21DRAFT_89524 [Setomelanomma holmii]